MPRYFFHVQDGISVRDEMGTELPDIYGARGQAVQLSGAHLGDMGSRFWRELGAHFWDGTEWRLEVTDEQGQALFVLSFSAKELLAPPSLGVPPQPGSRTH